VKRFGIFLLGLLALVMTTGCPVKPYVIAQRTILDAVDALKIADGAIVEAYPSIQGTDEERILWLTKAVCALRVSRDMLQIGWDVTFYWANDGKVCRLDGFIVPDGTAGAECTEGSRTWQDWVRLSAPVVIHAVQAIRDFGVDIPEEVITLMTTVGAMTGTDTSGFDEKFEACVEALQEGK